MKTSCCTILVSFKWLQTIDILETLLILKFLEFKESIAESLMTGILDRQYSYKNLSAVCTWQVVVWGIASPDLFFFYQCFFMWLVIIHPKQIGNLGYNNKKQRAICFLSQARATLIIQPIKGSHIHFTFSFGFNCN